MVTLQQARESVAQQRAALETQKQLLAGQKLQVQSQLPPQPSRSTLLSKAGGIMQKIKTGIQQVAFGQQKDTALQQVGTYEQSLKAQEQQLQDYETQIAQAEQAEYQADLARQARPSPEQIRKMALQTKDPLVRNLMLKDLNRAEREQFSEAVALQSLQQARSEAANILQPSGITFQDITPEKLQELNLSPVQLQTLEKAKLISIDNSPQVYDINQDINKRGVGKVEVREDYSEQMSQVDREAIEKLYGKTASGDLITASGGAPYIKRYLNEEQYQAYKIVNPSVPDFPQPTPTGLTTIPDTLPSGIDIKEFSRGTSTSFRSDNNNFVIPFGDKYDLPTRNDFRTFSRGTGVFQTPTLSSTPDVRRNFWGELPPSRWERSVPGSLLNLGLSAVTNLVEKPTVFVGKQNIDFFKTVGREAAFVGDLAKGYNRNKGEERIVLTEALTNWKNAQQRSDMKKYTWTPPNYKFEPWYKETGTSLPGKIKDTDFYTFPTRETIGGRTGTLSTPKPNSEFTFQDLKNIPRSGYNILKPMLYKGVVPNPFYLLPTSEKKGERLGKLAATYVQVAPYFIAPASAVAGVGAVKLLAPSATSQQRVEGAILLGAVGAGKTLQWGLTKKKIGTEVGKRWDELSFGERTRVTNQVDKFAPNFRSSSYKARMYSPERVDIYQSPIGTFLGKAPKQKVIERGGIRIGESVGSLTPESKTFISGQRKILFPAYADKAKKIPYRPGESEFWLTEPKTTAKITNYKLNFPQGAKITPEQFNKLPKPLRKLFELKDGVYQIQQGETFGLGKLTSVDIRALAKNKLKIEVTAIGSRDIPTGVGIRTPGIGAKNPLKISNTFEESRSYNPFTGRIGNVQASSKGIRTEIYLSEAPVTKLPKLNKADLRGILRAKKFEQDVFGMSSRDSAVKTFINVAKDDMFQTTLLKQVPKNIPIAPITKPVMKYGAKSLISSGTTSMLGIPRMVGGLGLTQTQINQSAYKQVPEFFEATRTPQELKEATDTIVITKSRGATKTIFDTGLRLKDDVILKPRDDVILRDIVIQKPGVVQKPKLEQLQQLGLRQQSRTRTRTRQGYGMPPPPPPPGKIIIVPPPSDDFGKSGKKGKGIKGLFVAEIRRRGKFEQVGEPSPFFKAVSTGKRGVAETLGASLRIRKYKTGEIVPLSPSGFFGPSKRETGVLVQRAGARLSSWGERREIKQSRRKIRWI